jgi:hypothetical protein
LNRRELIIRKGDSKSTRHSKKRFRKRLKRMGKTKHVFVLISKSDSDITTFCSTNKEIYDQLSSNDFTYKVSGKTFSLYDNTGDVIKAALQLLKSKNSRIFTLDFAHSGVEFGALYFIDSFGWYKSKKYNWAGAQFKNITPGKADILLNLRSNVTNETHCKSGHIINRRIKIERTKDKILYSKEYEIGSKQVRELIQNSIKECTCSPDYKLSIEMNNAIHSVISEQFDNIYQHAITATHAELCSMFDKNTKTISLLIFNYGPTYAQNLQKDDLPQYVKQFRDDVINNHRKKNFFGLGHSFTEENALTLLALQEGVSSKLDSDITRGYGLSDFIENCYSLSANSRIVIVSGRTTIRIDKKYHMIHTNLLGRNRRILALNDSGDIYSKPDSNYVLDHGAFFPGVIIETTIPLNI